MKKFIVAILMMLSFSSLAQKETYSGMLGYGAVIYNSKSIKTYASSHYGLSLRFAIEGMYFDVSSNLADGYTNWIHYSNSYFTNMPILNQYSQVNVWVVNMGYMIPFGKMYLTPTIGYAQTQQFFEDIYGTHYGKPESLLNCGLMVDMKITNHVYIYGGISVIEIGKFGMAFHF